MTPTHWFANQNTVVKVIVVFYGISVLISSFEKIRAADDYGENGWFAWQIFSFDRANIGVFRHNDRLVQRLFGKGGMTVLSCGGVLGVALLLLFPIRSLPFFAGALAALVATMSTLVRGFYGGDGAQQMNVIVGTSILIGFNPWSTPTTGAFCLVFIAAQSCLAYVTSGVAKLASPMWRSGDALPGILATTAYGSPFGYSFASSHPRLISGISKGVMVVETSFPIALIAPAPVLIAYLAFGAIFHMTSAVMMGLNTFFWSFLATYPAICFVWVALH